MSLGWTCPVCGKGCSPSLTQCPCKDTVVSTGTTFTMTPYNQIDYCMCAYFYSSNPGTGNCGYCGKPKQIGSIKSWNYGSLVQTYCVCVNTSTTHDGKCSYCGLRK